MGDGHAIEPIGAIDKISQWLWSKPLGNHSAGDDEEETADALVEEAQLEDEGQLRHLYFQRTVSREVPQELSRSGRVNQIAQHSALEFSRPTMSIRSQWSSWSSSPRPHQPRLGRSLTSLTPIAQPQVFNPLYLNSGLRRMDEGNIQRNKSMDSNGTPVPRTNSGYYIKGTEAPVSPGRFGLPLSVKRKTPNR
uniref:Movement protein P4 n=1 Tax=Sea celery virus A TaxID=1636508 RepID=A0A141AYI7_9TOMB|nr:movement protein P4 [Sea celery virus A]